MSDLKFFLDEDGLAMLETVGGYLHYFRGYRIQLSATEEGIGDIGSSASVLNHHFRFVEENCIKEQATKFIHLVGLSHVGEALRGNLDVIKQVKQSPDVFNQFMEHLLTTDFSQNTTYQFSLDDTLGHLQSVKLDSLQELTNIKYLEGVNEGSVSLAIGTIGSTAYVIDARTLEGYSLDFKEFYNEKSGFTEKLLDFARNTLLHLVTFKEEYPKLFPPHFYIGKERKDSVKYLYANWLS